MAERKRGFLVKLRQGRDRAFGAARADGLELEPVFQVERPAPPGMAAADLPADRWYLARPAADTGPENPWDDAHDRIESAHGFAAAGEVLAIEPDIGQSWATRPPGPAEPFAAAGCIYAEQDPDLPQGPGFAWHLRPDFSGLKPARDAVMANGAEVTIVHIDTGYDPDHGALPENLDRTRQKNYVDEDRPDDASDSTPEGGLLRNRGHGTGTLSILAGGRHRFDPPPGSNAPPFDDYVGGAPKARIVPVRAADSVVHFYTSAVAKALDHARQIGADVVSMSMGGLPSLAWADAVNAAYDAGVVMVCAAGNNFGGLPTRHIVYPARFRRVLAACGVMADGRPYYNLRWTQMQGNYGPSSTMATAMAAYTPNVSWAKLGCSEIVDMDGAGTSSATPQLAAAAALWLGKHKDALAGRPGWARVEAVRRALFDSAMKAAPDMTVEEVSEMLGKGVLRANDALAQPPAAVVALKPAEEDSATFPFLRLLTGLGMTGETARMRMFRLEMTQLALRSRELEQAVPDPDVPAENVTDRHRRRFIETILDEGGCSRALRAYLEQRIGRHTPGGERHRAPSPAEPGMAPSSGAVPRAVPPARRLRIYALDPSFSARLDTAYINEVTVDVSWEADVSNTNLLGPGPVGKYLEVVDVDPASNAAYPPVDLNDPFLLAQDGLAPSEGNPQFHQQMVYAVAMLTIQRFERALGRSAQWSPRLIRDNDGKVVAGVYVPRLRIYPHALRERNAYYSPAKKALLFGYFPAAGGATAAGSMVFTCLSHDVIAHETTHALLDGLHRRFQEGSNPDVYAFHEAFADIVALFQHFTYPSILRHELQRTRGDLREGDLLAELARQFGDGIGRSAALRSAINVPPEKFKYSETSEPHDRGAILVAAVFDAFLAIYRRRTGDLLRIATEGTGVLRPGALHPDLIARLADEAAKTAAQVLNICIRALDYAPPVDITFGDYLRALITADADLVPDDPLGYRIAFLEAFRNRQIVVNDVRTFSVESMRWREPPLQPPGLADLIARLDLGWDVNAERYEAYQAERANCVAVHKWIRNDLVPNQRLPLAKEFGLKATDALGRDLPFEVHSVRPARRVAPDGSFRTDLIIVITQRRDVELDPKQPASGTFPFRGGCTLIIDTRKGHERVRYAIVKNINSERRMSQQRQQELHGAALSLNALYFGDGERNEPFRMLHNGH